VGARCSSGNIFAYPRIKKKKKKKKKNMKTLEINKIQKKKA
jgi:hypothetical protein